MSSFEALTFNWNNESSINYDVYISNFENSSGWQTEPTGGNIRIISDHISRRTEQFIYGVKQNDVQQFTLTIGSEKRKSRAEIDRITSWLIRGIPNQLIVNQDDMRFYRYIGFFTNPQLISTGGNPLGMSFTFVSTSPFAYTFPQKKNITVNAPINYIFNNSSGNIDYLYPKISIVPSNVTQTFSIVNNSDNSRTFQFNFSSPFPDGSEIITVDNENQIITSSKGNDYSKRRFSQFNFKWLRFIFGANNLRITGTSNIELEYSFARRIGS